MGSATLAASAALHASVQLPLGVASVSGYQTDESKAKHLAACQNRRKRRAPRTEIEMFVGEATRTLALSRSAFGSRVCSSFLGAHRLQVARRRFVLLAFFLGARPLGLIWKFNGKMVVSS